MKQVDPFYLSKQWRTTRDKVLKRDGFKCQECGVLCLGRKRNKPSPHIDHIEPIKKRPDLRLHMSNLRVLCHPCHSRLTLNDRHSENKPEIGVSGYPVEPIKI